jgi:cellobiose PTS system EIIB component
MRQILLCCAGGFSSSLLVTKMQEHAKQHGVDTYHIWAIGVGEVERQLDHLRKADVLLVAPQVRYLLPDFQRLAQKEGLELPIDMIQPLHYGTCNGEAVLRYADELIAQKAK